MSRLVLMLEEPSIRALFECLLPRLFPDLAFLCITHEGKQDLERSLPRKLRGWNVPGDRFVVIRDNDGENCFALKAKLSTICAEAGRPETVVRIPCQELEAWFIAEPEALAEAFSDDRLRAIGTKAAYRNPDEIAKPSKLVAKLCPGYQKVSGARAMGARLSYSRNRSPSFRALVQGIARVAGRPLPD